MRRWAIVLLVVIAAVLIIFGGAATILIELLPEETQNNYIVYILSFVITYAIANGIVTFMQWIGKSPFDFLPNKTLKEKDPQRFKLTTMQDAKFLYEKAKEAEKNKEYDWAIAFAEALIRLKPSETRGYEVIGDSLLNLHRPSEALKYGEQLIAIQPLEYDGYWLLGKVYIELVNPQEARKYLEDALKYSDDNMRQHILGDLIEAYKMLGLAKEAAEAYEEHVQLSSQDILAEFKEQELSRLKRISGLSSEESSESV